MALLALLVLVAFLAGRFFPSARERPMAPQRTASAMAPDVLRSNTPDATDSLGDDHSGLFPDEWPLWRIDHYRGDASGRYDGLSPEAAVLLTGDSWYMPDSGFCSWDSAPRLHEGMAMRSLPGGKEFRVGPSFV